MTNEDSALEEAIDNLREAAQRIHATQNLMHAQGMAEDVNYRELLTRLSIRRLLLREAALMWRLSVREGMLVGWKSRLQETLKCPQSGPSRRRSQSCDPGGTGCLEGRTP